MRAPSSSRRRDMVGVVDVARAAQCSTTTVSRVLNAPELVSPETRSRVEDAIQALGYMPNGAARALRSKRSRMIGTVIPTLGHAIYSSFVEAVQQRLSASQYSLLVATSEYDLALECQQASLLIERGAEGLILIGALHRPALHRLVEDRGIPHVNAYVFRGDDPYACVGIDNLQAASTIVEHLHGLGHRRFGVISGVTRDNDRVADRIEGLTLALAARDLALRPDAILEMPYSIANGRRALRRLAWLRPRPTAIVCANDVLAMGALIECQELGIAVPDAMSIVGFADLEFAPHLAPPLTTMEVPTRQMGADAASVLIDALNGDEGTAKIRLEPTLIVRGTTAPPPVSA